MYVSNELRLENDTFRDMDDVGICSKKTCSPLNGRAMFEGGESGPLGDYLIVDIGWELSDEIIFQCPEQFQTPMVTVLGCQTDDTDGSDCTSTGWTIDPNDSDLHNPGNSVEFNLNSPGNNYIRARFGILCMNPTPVFTDVPAAWVAPSK